MAVDQEGVLVEVGDVGPQEQTPHPGVRALPPFEDGRFRDNNFDGASIIDIHLWVIVD